MTTNTNLLDEWFPRDEQPETDAGPRTPKIHIPGFGTAEGVTSENNAPWQPTRKPTKKKGVTPLKLQRIGEGLTQYVFEKQLGIKLEKIQTGIGYYGQKLVYDVDFQSVGRIPLLKVEAKTWWIWKRGSFAISRISKNERVFLDRAVNSGCDAWLTIALIDHEKPSRATCNALYIVTWQRWLEIEKELKRRSAGSYKGKSLRRRDMDLLSGYELRKLKRRWMIPAAHWLNEAKQ